MKKFDLLKVLGITFMIVLLLSWVIPAGAFSSGVFKSLGSTVTIGLYDVIRTPAITIATFIQYGLLFLAIGGFYGVLNKTGVYSNLVNKLVNKWKEKRGTFLVITVIVFALLTSLTALPNVVFILVPMFIAILLKLGYNKMSAFAATVGAILVGQIGNTIGFNIWGYLMVLLELKMSTVIGARIILFLMITTLFVLLLIKNTKKEVPVKNSKKKKEEIKEEVEIPLYEENTSKKGTMPLIVISIFMLVVLVLGMFNWAYAFNFKFFGTLHDSITTFQIGTYPIFGNLLGSVSELGYWGNYDLVVVLIVASLLIGWVYNVKMHDMIEGFVKGAKKMLPTAIYAMLACIVFACILNMSSGNFVNTIVDKLLSSSETFSFFGTVGSGLITSFFYNDFYTLINSFAPVLGVYDANSVSIIAFLIQGLYGFVMLIAPTSIFLLAGLKYMDIPYKEWMKYIWKFALIVLGIILVVGFILTMLV